MDREIKFRGNRIDNGEWIYGYYQKWKHFNGKSFDIIHAITNNECGDSETVVVHPESVGQFTGLSENAYETGNKEIYEGHIIEFINGERLSVEWNDDTCKFQFSDGTDINDGERYGSHKMIIGNIYENHELINS